eukprot:TRINITY_DN63_c0_g1_i1.p1 TRINITY_DN63_c0_g1~~TRINITY_DN63_c0_g1_i1.p1  ORF type:complete len:735 (+),score=200.65 TRINITY_DN63_c0_g1_i1:62-2206(+)
MSAAQDQPREAHLSLPLPRLHVAMLAVGDDDVEAFCRVGRVLAAEYGHRVRVAAHDKHSRLVESCGHEFCPIAGDPALIMRARGPLSAGDAPAISAAVGEMLASLPSAVTEVRPGGMQFTPDLLIANPPIRGHIHVAEWLGVPLHLMSMEPGVPTASFPALTTDQVDRGAAGNLATYRKEEEQEWVWLQPLIAQLRLQLRLPSVHWGMEDAVFARVRALPFAFLWSEKLTPKPPDWGISADVVGCVKLDPVRCPSVDQTSVAVHLVEVLELKPVLICLVGDMNAAVAGEVVRRMSVAAEDSGTPVVLELDEILARETARYNSKQFVITPPIAHGPILSKLSGIMHSGTARATMEGLDAGLPTLVCPGTGPQAFCGLQVERAGVGPGPWRQMQSVAELVKAFQLLSSMEIKAKVAAMAVALKHEDGAAGAAAAVHRHLPRVTIVCDVCARLLQCNERNSFGPSSPQGSGLACYQVEKTGVRLCARCVAELGTPFLGPVHPLRYADHAADGPEGIVSGIARGSAYLASQSVTAVTDLLSKPAQGYQEGGGAGLVMGAAEAMKNVFWRPIKGGAVMCEQAVVGTMNSYDGGKRKDLFSSGVREQAQVLADRQDPRTKRLAQQAGSARAERPVRASAAAYDEVVSFITRRVEVPAPRCGRNTTDLACRPCDGYGSCEMRPGLRWGKCSACQGTGSNCPAATASCIWATGDDQDPGEAL